MIENPEDITMRAIGRTPARDKVQVEAQLAAEPELAEQLRETENLAVEIWQASSPLESAPPELWEKIEASLAPPPTGIGRYWLPVTASLGWVAAFSLAALLIFKKAPSEDSRISSSPIARTEPQISVKPVAPTHHPGTESNNQSQNQALRNQLTNLQQQLTKLRTSSPSIAPRIITLHPPGATRRQSPEEERTQLLELLATALQKDLQRQREHPVDLIIEEGWDPKFFSADHGLLIRHRDFLTATADLNLMIARNGDYYEPSSNYLWSPAEDGGGYLGQAADDTLDLESFTWVEKKDSEPESALVQTGISPPPPQGYLLQDASTGEATLILEGLGEDRKEANLFARYQGPDGTLLQHPLQSTSFGDASIVTSSLGQVGLLGNFSVGAVFSSGKEVILVNSAD